MVPSTAPETVAGESPHADLEHLIKRAAHLLPAQGPITAFVHHNTLHAFEDLSFEDAVVKGAETFGCHPYLPEERYRQKLARGRILQRDIEAVLIDDLENDGDELLGFLGTRFHLRLAMLAHPLRTGPTAELRWVVEETESLRTFREETPPPNRDLAITDTRHWIMRDLRNGRTPNPIDERIRRTLDCLCAVCQRSQKGNPTSAESPSTRGFGGRWIAFLRPLTDSTSKNGTTTRGRCLHFICCGWFARMAFCDLTSSRQRRDGLCDIANC